MGSWVRDPAGSPERPAITAGLFLYNLMK